MHTEMIEVFLHTILDRWDLVSQFLYPLQQQQNFRCACKSVYYNTDLANSFFVCPYDRRRCCQLTAVFLVMALWIPFNRFMHCWLAKFFVLPRGVSSQTGVLCILIVDAPLIIIYTGRCKCRNI